MKRHILDLTKLRCDSNSILDWMNAPPWTHVRIAGVLLTRQQMSELARLDVRERMRRIEEMRTRSESDASSTSETVPDETD
jgi:hypothetical protein